MLVLLVLLGLMLGGVFWGGLRHQVHLAENDTPTVRFDERDIVFYP